MPTCGKWNIIGGSRYRLKLRPVAYSRIQQADLRAGRQGSMLQERARPGVFMERHSGGKSAANCGGQQELMVGQYPTPYH